MAFWSEDGIVTNHPADGQDSYAEFGGSNASSGTELSDAPPEAGGTEYLNLEVDGDVVRFDSRFHYTAGCQGRVGHEVTVKDGFIERFDWSIEPVKCDELG